MPSILLVYAVIASLTLAVLVLFLQKGDESTNRHLSKVRVRIDDDLRSHTPEPRDDDFERSISPEWIVLGSLMLLILLILGKV